MSRSTKIGLWLVPWLPIGLTAFVVFVFVQLNRPHTALVQKQPDGRFKWTTQFEPWEYNTLTTGHVLLAIFAVSFLVGLVLLALALLRKLRQPRTSSA